MQETAKQAGDVISVSELETQSAIGFVRWRIQSGLEKLRLRSSKSRPASTKPYALSSSGSKEQISRGSGKEGDLRQSTSSEHLSKSHSPMRAESKSRTRPGENKHIIEPKLQNVPNMGMHRRVLDALLRKGRPSSSLDLSSSMTTEGNMQKAKKGSKASCRDRLEDIALRSAGPGRDDRIALGVDERIVVSEGESVGYQSNADTADSECTTSSDDYGETPENRHQRLFVGAGGLISSEEDGSEDGGSRRSEVDRGDRDWENHAVNEQRTDIRGASVYSGSESSDSAPVEIRRRRPTGASTRRPEIHVN